MTVGFATVPPAHSSCRDATREGWSIAAQRLADDVSLLNAHRVQIGQQVVAVARDLVRVVRLAGVAVAEHVDGVAGVPRRVDADVADERLQVPTGPVQEDHRLASARLERPGRYPAGVHCGHSKVGADQLGPDRHRSLPWLIRCTCVLLLASALRSA
jgi:hypothetical protein